VYRTFVLVLKLNDIMQLSSISVADLSGHETASAVIVEKFQLCENFIETALTCFKYSTIAMNF